MAQVFEIVVELDTDSESQPTRRSCSPSPSTSSSSPSSSGSTPSSTPETVRRMNKKSNASSWHYLGERRRLRRNSASKVKLSKRLTSASKFRLWKQKVDKEHERKLAARMANIERIKRERELLRAGTSQLAILCNTLTENARSLRQSYERQQAVVYQMLISRTNNQSEDGFIGHIYY